MCSGAPNKNIGDAFLCVWKTETFHENTLKRMRSTSQSENISRQLSADAQQLQTAAAQAALSRASPSPTKEDSRRISRRLSLKPSDLAALVKALPPASGGPPASASAASTAVA